MAINHSRGIGDLAAEHPLQRQTAPSVRHGERDQLVAMLDALDHGQGRVVELVGDPGIGKTRLLADLTAEARRRGVAVLTGRCAEVEQDLPFQVVRHLAASPLIADWIAWLPDEDAALLTATLDGTAETADSQRFASYQTMRMLLTSCARDRMVLVLDDFHWADPASVELVDYLVRWPVHAPLLVVIAQRTRQASTRLRGTLAHGIELGSVARIELAPLTPDQSAELLGMRAEDPRLRDLHRDSFGNPLYLLALAHAKPGQAAEFPVGMDEIPTQYAALLMTEMDSLNPVESMVATTAAVLGDRFDMDAVADVSGLTPARTDEAVGRLMHRDVLRAVQGSSHRTFRHPVLRALLYANTAPAWRRVAHRRAAEVLARRSAPAAELATHIERCPVDSDPDDLAILLRAAEDTMLTAPADAAHWLRVAMSVHPPEGRLELQLRLAGALSAAGEAAECRALLHEIIGMSPAAPPDVRFAAVQQCALLDCFLGRDTEAESLLTRELMARPEPSAAHAAALVVGRGIVRLLARRALDTAEVERALEVARAEADRVVEAGALALLGFQAAADGDLRVGGTRLALCASVVDLLDDAELTAHPANLLVLGWAEILVGRLSEAEHHLGRGVAMVRRSAQVFVLPTLLIGLSNAYQHMGRLADARQAAADAKKIAYEVNGEQVQGLALALEALVATWMNGKEAGRSVALAESAFVRLKPGRSVWPGIAAVTLARAARFGGEPRRCVDRLVAAGGGPMLTELAPLMRPEAFEMLVDSTIATGDPDAAADWADLAVAAADELGLPPLRAHALLAVAHLARAQRAPGLALARYQEAADLLGNAGMAGLQSWALTRAAACAVELGREPDAVRLLWSAKAIARWCGAQWIVEQTAQLEARVATAAPSDDGRAVLEVLTDREREIAVLAGKGKRTKEIADQLVLSPRTVDVHLGRIYRKLNVTSRAALARLIAQIG